MQTLRLQIIYNL